MNLNSQDLDYTNISVADLLNKEGDTLLSYAIKFSLTKDHENRNSILNKILDLLCNELEKNKHVKTRKTSTEDSLTIELTTNLKNLSIHATHDTQYGGHCDIVVEASNSFLWLAEAKIHSDYGWLEKGFMQLATRYSTGAYGQDTGAVIIYCWNQKSVEVLEKWRSELETAHPEVKVDKLVDRDHLVFSSVHSHKSTGRDFRVRHKIVSLHFEPEDN